MPLLVDSIKPMLLGEVRRPFSDEAWTFELKFDGYRILAERNGMAAALRTRNGADATKWFPEVASALAGAAPDSYVVDGEVCVLDDIGRSDFNRLQDRARTRRFKPGADPVVYCIFDLLVVEGESIVDEPLATRRERLAELFSAPVPSVLIVRGADGQGEWLYEQALALKLEGIVAKRLDSPYLPGIRSDAWLKIKRPGAVPAERFKR